MFFLSYFWFLQTDLLCILEELGSFQKFWLSKKCPKRSKNMGGGADRFWTKSKLKLYFFWGKLPKQGEGLWLLLLVLLTCDKWQVFCLYLLDFLVLVLLPANGERFSVYTVRDFHWIGPEVDSVYKLQCSYVCMCVIPSLWDFFNGLHPSASLSLPFPPSLPLTPFNFCFTFVYKL